MKNPSTLTDLINAVEEMNVRFPRAFGSISITAPLDISVKPNVSWPSNKHAGVYVFLDEKNEILYIGKASFGSCIGSRLNKRFDSDWIPKSQYSKGCKYITTIPVPDAHRFEAPAIEEFLLSRLKTRSNSVGS